MPRLNTIKIRRGTAAAWTAANPVLEAGEPGLETDTNKVKYGDGATAWNSLAYSSSASSVAVRTATGTSDTLVAADAGKVVRYTAAGAVTATVPPNSDVAFDTGTIINIYSAGAGGVTIAAGAGVTIRNNASGLSQYGECSLRKDGTDEWVRAG